MNFTAIFVRKKGNKAVIIEFWARTEKQANQSMKLYAKELDARLDSVRQSRV